MTAYNLPALVAVVAPASVIAVTNTTVIAAPGAGFAIRVVTAHLHQNRQCTGLADMQLQDGVGGIAFHHEAGLNAAAGGRSEPFIIPYPGFQLTVNTLLNLSHNSSVAAGNLVCVVYYFIDSVT